jgi:hypothetical protein
MLLNKQLYKLRLQKAFDSHPKVFPLFFQTLYLCHLVKQTVGKVLGVKHG